MVITGSVLLIGWQISRRVPKPETESNPWISIAAAVGISASYTVCHFGLHGKPAGNQPEAWEWLLLLVPIAAVVGGISAWLGPTRKYLHIALYLALSLTVGWFLVPSFQASPWLWRAVLAVTVFTLVVAQSWWRPTALVWVVTCSFGLPVLIASANAKFGFFATSIAAASGACFLFWLFVSRTQFLGACVPVVSTLIPSILFSGYFNDYGDVPLDAFAVIVCSPLLVWIASFFTRKEMPTALISLLLVAFACSFALFRVWPILTAEPAY